MNTVNRLIDAYRLVPSEKSASHFQLDDYGRYLPYLWGSAQLAAAAATANGDGPLSKPTCLTDWDAVCRHRDEHAVHDVLTRCVDGAYSRAEARPLWQHSYQLWNLSGLPTWHRVNEGLSAAFERQVLGRFGTMKRLVFGELLGFAAAQQRPPTDRPNSYAEETEKMSTLAEEAEEMEALAEEMEALAEDKDEEQKEEKEEEEAQ